MSAEAKHSVERRLVVVGSGPAAFTAALYGTRLGLSVHVFEGALTEENRVNGTLPLGQLNFAQQVLNYPGFPDGVFGSFLGVQMREQAERAGARLETEDVVAADLSHGPFRLTISDGALVEADALVVATGASLRKLSAPGIDRLMYRGVSVCLDDAPLPRFRNRPMVVIGGGDSAVETALFTAKFSGPVYLVCRGTELRARDLTAADEALHHPKIVTLFSTEVVEVFGEEDGGVTSVRLLERGSGMRRDVESKGVFPMIGRLPHTAWLHGQLALDAAGYVKLVGPTAAATSVPGVFAAGEVADPIYRQVVTAAAQGCQAAMDAARWLRGNG